METGVGCRRPPPEESRLASSASRIRKRPPCTTTRQETATPGIRAIAERWPQRAVAGAANRRTAPARAAPAARRAKAGGQRACLPIAVEQYRRFAGALHELQIEQGLKTLMVTSAVPDEGKTLTVANLALTLSESCNRRVLLIDADLRRPCSTRCFACRMRGA